MACRIADSTSKKNSRSHRQLHVRPYRYSKGLDTRDLIIDPVTNHHDLDVQGLQKRYEYVCTSRLSCRQKVIDYLQIFIINEETEPH